MGGFPDLRSLTHKLLDMIIQIVTPARPGSLKGNRVTASRWRKLLRGLGHQVHLTERYAGRRCDLLIALHAIHSHPSLVEFRRMQPGKPIVLMLTGTDLYEDRSAHACVSESMDLADRLVVLQPKARELLPTHLQAKTMVIFQSVHVPARLPDPAKSYFQVCVLGHLRPVKDPFRTPLAAQLLPPESRIRVVHLGCALSPEMAEEARFHQRTNPRYRWAGGLPRWRAARYLAASHLHVLSSTVEGGANALGEAIAFGVPSLLSRIPGSEGMVGEEYPGFFPVLDTESLARLLDRSERDEEFYRALKQRTLELQARFRPEEERRKLESLLMSLRD